MECVMLSVLTFCFFKQKTAYEMRISDWSSDVCSSDLFLALPRRLGETLEIDGAAAFILAIEGHEIEVSGPNHPARAIDRPVGRDRGKAREQVGADERRVGALPLLFIRPQIGDRKSTRLNSSH